LVAREAESPRAGVDLTLPPACLLAGGMLRWRAEGYPVEGGKA